MYKYVLPQNRQETFIVKIKILKNYYDVIMKEKFQLKFMVNLENHNRPKAKKKKTNLFFRLEKLIKDLKQKINTLR